MNDENLTGQRIPKETQNTEGRKCLKKEVSTLPQVRKIQQSVASRLWRMKAGSKFNIVRKKIDVNIKISQIEKNKYEIKNRHTGETIRFDILGVLKWSDTYLYEAIRYGGDTLRNMDGSFKK